MLAAGCAGVQSFPGHASPVGGLFCCGDSTFPGIGVPAVAGSGIAVAHAIAHAAGVRGVVMGYLATMLYELRWRHAEAQA